MRFFALLIPMIFALSMPAAAQQQPPVVALPEVEQSATPALAVPPPDAPVSAAPAAAAQTQSAPPAEALPVDTTAVSKGVSDISTHKSRISPPGLLPNDLGSLLFTPWQQALLEESRRNSALPKNDAAKKNNILGLDGPQNQKPKDPGIRVISLGGIVYEGDQNWTIWLNGARVTPKTTPKEAISLKVKKDTIEMIWLDPYTEKAFPIRLRAHQTFNLDSKRFGPGKTK